MIDRDQPTCFPTSLLVRVSSKSDGTMLDKRHGTHAVEAVHNRELFCVKHGIDYQDVVYQRIVYGEQQTYDTIVEVDAQYTQQYREEVMADALVTHTQGVGLFLPIADCAGTVIYDPVHHCVALVHLGRHSTVANLMEKTINYLVVQGSRVHDLVIWMAPSVKKSSYRLDYFDDMNEPAWREFAVQRSDGIYLDIPGYNRAVALRTGVLSTNIHESAIDTAAYSEYFSHSQGDVSGRFAVLVMLR